MKTPRESGASWVPDEPAVAASGGRGVSLGFAAAATRHGADARKSEKHQRLRLRSGIGVTSANAIALPERCSTPLGSQPACTSR
jgi:hypothetical protein